MNSPLILAVMLLASPAMAGGTTYLEKTTPATELEVCTINLRNMKDFMGQVQAQLAASSAEALARADAPVAKPVVQAMPRACPALPRQQKCKRGRTQSPKHNCKCGVWS